MRISQEINRIGGDLAHNDVAVGLVAAVALVSVVLMQRGMRTYGAQAVTWSRAKLAQLRAWWHPRGESPQLRALRAHAEADWYAWEQELAGQREHEPPHDPAP